MYTIYFINFDYVAQDTFTDFQAALAHAKRCGFDCRIDLDNKPVAAWSIIGGTHMFEVARA